MSWGKIVGLFACGTLVAGCSATPIESPEAQSAPAGASSVGDFEPRLSEKFETPWSTEVSRRELVETALFNLFRDLDSIRDDDCKVQPVIFTSDPFLPEHIGLLEQISYGMVASFCKYLSNDIPVVAGRYTYLKEVLASEGLPTDDFGGNCGFEVIEDASSGCAAFGSVWTGIQLGTIREGKPFVEDRRLTIAAHEIMHNIHDQINPKGEPGLGTCRGEMNFACAGPVWLYEGAGEFFGRAMTQYLGLQNYDTFVPTDRNGYYIDGAYLSNLDFLTTQRNKGFGVENYYSGQIAMELMIANMGLLPVLGIWENMNSGLDFPDAFESSLGISLEEFYEIFSTFHNRIYEEAGYCASAPGCDDWVPPQELPDWYAKLPDSQGIESSSGESSTGASNQISDECDFSAEWWHRCTPLELNIPRDPENSNHGLPLDYERIPKVTVCEEFTEIGISVSGFAKTFEIRDRSGATELYVSTQYYAALNYLDKNLDGIVCSAQLPD